MADEHNKHNEAREQSATKQDAELDQRDLPPEQGQSLQERPGQEHKAQEQEVRKSRVPVWLFVLYKIFRILLVPVLCIVALYIGLRIGYSNFGGQDPEDVLDPNTWKHLFDLIFKD